MLDQFTSVQDLRHVVAVLIICLLVIGFGLLIIHLALAAMISRIRWRLKRLENRLDSHDALRLPRPAQKEPVR